MMGDGGWRDGRKRIHSKQSFAIPKPMENHTLSFLKHKYIFNGF
jgi:hypothetical protein